jgi:plastocyanin
MARVARLFLVCSSIFWACAPLNAGPEGGTVTGIVIFKGTRLKTVPFDLTKDPACAQMHATHPLTYENILAGPGNGLANVVVYISAGEADPAAASANSVTFKQQGCQYATHVLVAQAGQEIKIINSDPVPHNIHALAKVNREWSRIQPPATPPFSYSYEKEEFISVRCNIHPWMQGYFVILKTGHFAVTGENGVFRLPDLPPGKYTITAWHESLGTQSQEIKIAAGETKSLYLSFPANP